MAIETGTRIGPYEIVSPIPGGSMGEVYRARDPRLRREAAIKVLPAAYAEDPESLRRFEHEARAASALNHPNIVTVYDVGSSEGVSYIAMEFVEGQSLRDFLSAGKPTLQRILETGSQLADGLAAAHARGLVHRDLKPQNVMVTKDGLVKILDFGLAKQTAAGSLSAEAAGVTAERSLTTPGTILGTVGYMSPEQARGESADARSDQFSLGVILYEMASGRRAFDRGSAIETLSAILRDEPGPLSELDPTLPELFCWIVERCLAKDPGGRYESTRDLARDLRTLRDHRSRPSSGSRGIASAREDDARGRLVRPALIAATVLFSAALAAVAAWKLRRPAEPPLYEPLTFDRGTIWSARFAPDGKDVLYAAAWEGAPFRIFRKGPESATSRRLDLPDANLLAVSRSGEIAADVRIRVVPPGGMTLGTLVRGPLEGGAPREIESDVLFADWSPDGKDLAVVRLVGATTVLEYPVGKKLYETAGFASHPRISAAGDIVAFIDHPARGDNSGSVAVVDRSGKKRTVSRHFSAAEGLAWHPRSGEIWIGATVEQDAHAVYAVSLSGRTRVVARAPGNLTVQDISADGRVLLTRDSSPIGIMARGTDKPAETNLSWLDASFLTDLSGDGQRILFTQFGRTVGVSYRGFLRRLDGSNPMNLGEGFAQALSPDGGRVLSLARHAPPQLQVLPTGATGAGQPTQVPLEGLAVVLWASWFPDGRAIVVAGAEPGQPIRLYACEPDGGRRRTLTPDGVLMEHYQGVPISPDGSRLAAVMPDGRLAVFPADGGEPRPIPDLPAHELPVAWSPDGQSLYVFDMFESPAKVERVNVSTGRRELWKTLAVSDPAGVHGYPSVRMTADGSAYAYSYARFLSELYLVGGLD
jgi:Tol biopolymer transport system component